MRVVPLADYAAARCAACHRLTGDEAYMCDGAACHPDDTDVYSDDARVVCLRCAVTHGIGFSTKMTEEDTCAAFWCCKRCVQHVEFTSLFADPVHSELSGGGF